MLAVLYRFLNDFTLDDIMKRIVKNDDEDIGKEKEYSEIPVFMQTIDPPVKTDVVSEHKTQLEDDYIKKHKVYMLRPSLCIPLVHFCSP